MNRFILAAALAANVALPTLPAMAAANVSCAVPNNVTCTASSSRGIRSVTVTVAGPTGPVNVVDKSYSNCPAQVQYSFDSAYQVQGTSVRECPRFGRGTSSGSGGGLKLAN